MLPHRRIILLNYSILQKYRKILRSDLKFPAYFSTTRVNFPKIQVDLNSEILEKLEKDEIKARRHDGVNKVGTLKLPERIEKAIVKLSGDHTISELIHAGEKLNRYLNARKAPPEDVNVRHKIMEIDELVMADPKKYKLPKFPIDESNEIEMKNFMNRKSQVVQQILKQKMYTWQPIVFDKFTSLVYLVGRSVPEYSVLMKVFKEIQRRDPNFKPNSFFDFGAGIGTGTWVVSELWKDSIYEYYLVDSSREMNDLSELVLRDGNENKHMKLRNVNYRQFLPGDGVRYDIVLSAYSLFELPNLKSRLSVAQNLWKKTDNYLVFVEQGTTAGFHMLNEIREFLMNLRTKEGNGESFIFAPCTHEVPTCPRMTLDDGTPCNYSVMYQTHSFYRPMSLKTETFCYLVIKKGSQPTEQDRWPRFVRYPLVRHKHVVCRLCTEKGDLLEAVITRKKHGKFIYRCAKASNWGDQFPAALEGGMIMSNKELEEEKCNNDDDDVDSDDEKNF